MGSFIDFYRSSKAPKNGVSDFIRDTEKCVKIKAPYSFRHVRKPYLSYSMFS